MQGRIVTSAVVRSGGIFVQTDERSGPVSVFFNGCLQPNSGKDSEMSVAKVTEISSSSKTSFEDAIQRGIERADKTLDKVKGAWINEMKVDVDDGKVTAYRVNMKVTFILKG
jgi:flavin-binding protein dodecin